MLEKEFKKEPFLKYNPEASCSELSEVDAFVFAAIAYHMNDKSGRCYPSISRLCIITGYNKTTVLKSIKALIKKGLITVEKIKSDSSKYYKNSYIIPRLDKGFIMMSHRFIEADEEKIPKDLKAFLIKIHPLIAKNVDGDKSNIGFDYTELSMFLNCSEKTVRRKIKRLTEKNIVGKLYKREVVKNGLSSIESVLEINLHAINQEILEIKEDVENLKEVQSATTKDVEVMKKQLEELARDNKDLRITLKELLAEKEKSRELTIY